MEWSSIVALPGGEGASVAVSGGRRSLRLVSSTMEDFPLRDWEQYDCVRKALGKAPLPVAARTGDSAGSGNPVSDAIKNALGN
jgi:hypothetical protein